MEVVVSDNIFKNGIAVGVPGTDGARGNEIAAALAVFCGHSAYSPIIPSVYRDLKKMGWPVYGLYVTPMEIALSVELLAEQLRSRSFKNSQLGLQRIEICRYDRITERAVTPCFVLEASIMLYYYQTGQWPWPRSGRGTWTAPGCSPARPASPAVWRTRPAERAREDPGSGIAPLVAGDRPRGHDGQDQERADDGRAQTTDRKSVV